MANPSGFMIPLDQTDWSPGNGNRTNFCTSPNAWWTNQNIWLQGGSLGRTDAKVGEAVTIMVGIQGLADPAGGGTNAYIRHVQAWATYPSPTPGTTSSALVVPSMPPPNNNPSYPGPGEQPIWLYQSPTAGDYQSTVVNNTANPPAPPYVQVALSPQWTPQASDLVPPNTITHCCLIASSEGLADATQVGINVQSAYPPVGAWVQNYTQLGLIQICSTPQQGQINIFIHPLAGGRRPFGQFGFLAASPSAEERVEVVVDVRPLPQKDGIDPAVRRALEAGPYRDLDLQPARSELKALRLTENKHECEGHLATLIREAEKITKEAIEDIAHPFRDSCRLRLKLPPNGVQHLLLEAETEEEAPGRIHTFDIVQTEPGRRGGIRVAMIFVP
jgi:hypothetical protein